MPHGWKSCICGFFMVSFFLISFTVLAGQTVPDRRQAAGAEAHTPVPPLVILDAGHGGEDGGAVSASGIAEKTLNLSIVLRLGDMLEAAGIPVSYTRTSDTGLYEGAQPGHRKMADLRNRLNCRLEHPEAVFVSVHMNTFPSEACRGMQIFYAPQDKDSKTLAEGIRDTARLYLQKDNQRACKAADASIYLLYHSPGTAVLAECGFLSNPEEAALLSSPAYQGQIAAVLCSALLDFFSNSQKNPHIEGRMTE